MGPDQSDYKTSLKELQMEELSKVFDKRTIKNPKLKHMFPVRKEERRQKRRHTEFYIVKKANNERLKR